MPKNQWSVTPNPDGTFDLIDPDGWMQHGLSVDAINAIGRNLPPGTPYPGAGLSPFFNSLTGQPVPPPGGPGAGSRPTPRPASAMQPGPPPGGYPTTPYPGSSSGPFYNSITNRPVLSPGDPGSSSGPFYTGNEP